MRAPPAVPGDSAEELFEEAPCGYLSTRLDGTIVRVNRTFERWTGFGREQLLEQRRFQDLLAPGGRIYLETHCLPLLHMQGAIREIAMEVVRADGSRLPVLVNSTLVRDDAGAPSVIRTMVFDASDRRRYEQELLRAGQAEHDVALQLQRSLLAGRLPQGPGLQVAATHRAGERALEVGGDWYDAFWLTEHETVALVVGDVVGRGIEAAATMGQLRAAVRALALTGLEPGALIEALDGYAHRHEVGRMSTLVHAHLDLASGVLRYAAAGHPPPVVVTPDAPAAYAWGGRSTPLDAFGTTRPRAVGELALPPGSTVVLYTDGLVERRDEPLATGFDALLEEVEPRRDVEPAALAGALVRARHDPAHRDDVCLLVARTG